MSTLEGYLVAGRAAWQIPAYAQDMLWVQCAGHSVQASGPRGQFAIEQPPAGAVARLTWGHAGGPLLAEWTPAGAAFAAGWQGEVIVGGFVERLHAFETRHLELVIAEIEGDALPPGHTRVPGLEQMRAATFSRRDETYPAPDRRFTYTVIALAESIYAEYLHHAMVSELALDCFTRLGPQDGRWHEIVGLPLLVEAVALLAPGYR